MATGGRVLDRIARFLASGFGAGFSPVAPGTVGSAVAVAIGAGLLRSSTALLVLACLLASLVGIWAVRRLNATDDPGWVVIDEFAGQWIALLGLDEASWRHLLAAFVLFRLFDILKPRPVAWADQRKDAIGVMADDMIAGTMAAMSIAAIDHLWPGLLH